MEWMSNKYLKCEEVREIGIQLGGSDSEPPLMGFVIVAAA